MILLATGEEQHLVEDGDACESRLIRFEGTIEGIEEKNNRSVLQIKNTSVSDSGVLFYPEENSETEHKLHIGSKIRCEGVFHTFDEPGNKGQFDQRRYYALKGYTYVVYGGKILSVSSSYDRVRERLRILREDAACVYESYFEPEEYGVIEALLFADKSKLDPDIKEQYQNAGISHILALSGLHIVTLGFMLLGLLRRLRFPLKLSAVLTVSVMFMYCMMTGMQVSAVRAIIMFVISVAALLVGRTYDLKTSSALTAMIMLMMDPDRVYDAGFLLSFSAILGIGFVYPGIREAVMDLFGKVGIKELHRSEKWYVRAIMALLRTLLFSASLQLALMPPTMWFFYKLPVYGIFINLAAVPLAGVLLFASIISGILGSVAVFAVHCRLFTYIVLMPAVYVTKGILKLYDLMTGITEGLPGSIWITGRPGIWQIVIYYLFLILALVCSRMTSLRKINDKKRLRTGAAFTMALCLAGTAILFIRTDPKFQISALDVGQGQCFVMHGRKIPAIIYDCGSSDEKNIAKYRLLPFLKYNGISDLDTLFVSHLDSDHVNGIIELLEEEDPALDIGRIIISGAGVQKESDNYQLLLQAAAKRDVPVYKMSAGDTLNWGCLSAVCISPDPKDETACYDVNNSSLVLSFEYMTGDRNEGGSDGAFNALFTGDIDSKTEEALPIDETIGRGKGYDYLQVAHHGSRSSASEDFIRRVSPKVAVVSAGRDKIATTYKKQNNASLSKI